MSCTDLFSGAALSFPDPVMFGYALQMKGQDGTGPPSAKFLPEKQDIRGKKKKDEKSA